MVVWILLKMWCPDLDTAAEIWGSKQHKLEWSEKHLSVTSSLTSMGSEFEPILAIAVGDKMRCNIFCWKKFPALLFGWKFSCFTLISFWKMCKRTPGYRNGRIRRDFIANKSVKPKYNISKRSPNSETKLTVNLGRTSCYGCYNSWFIFLLCNVLQ